MTMIDVLPNKLSPKSDVQQHKLMSKSDVQSKLLPKFDAQHSKLLSKSDAQPPKMTSEVDVHQGKTMSRLYNRQQRRTTNTSDVQTSSCMASKTRIERKSSESSGLELFPGFWECSKQTVFTTTVVTFFRRGHKYTQLFLLLSKPNQLDPTDSTPLRPHMVRSSPDSPQLALHTQPYQASSDRRPSTPCVTVHAQEAALC